MVCFRAGSDGAKAKLEGLRFNEDSSLTFAIEGEVIAWDPAKNTKTVRARAPGGQRIVAFAAAANGFLLATVE